MQIRKGTAADIPAVYDLIYELAVYEKAPHEVDNTVERMLEDGFGEKPIFEFFVAEDAQKQIQGIALYYYRYSTWKGKCIYLEDFVVRESERGKGTGRLLFDELVREAQRVDARLITWQVLDWNEPAINFYKKLEADLDSGWINCKLSKNQIDNYFKL